ncbi:MAG TPA: hypothetical protein PLN52_00990 [Opitutaceae bacterium]|nr:hypothetical protein [Opitutaceae bacterium]
MSSSLNLSRTLRVSQRLVERAQPELQKQSLEFDRRVIRAALAHCERERRWDNPLYSRDGKTRAWAETPL